MENSVVTCPSPITHTNMPVMTNESREFVAKRIWVCTNHFAKMLVITQSTLCWFLKCNLNIKFIRVTLWNGFFLVEWFFDYCDEAEAILLGFQHFIVMLATTVIIPSALVPQMGGRNVRRIMHETQLLLFRIFIWWSII